MTQENQQLFAEIDSQARNCSLTPSEKQINANNYKKGHINFHGLKISVENPRNSYREGIDKDGEKWESRMNSHYGDILGTLGADGDPIDVFIGFYPESSKAFVINQIRTNHNGAIWSKGDFDEHKVMLGFPDAENAKSSYLMSYERGWNGIGSIVEATIEQIKWWVFNGNTKIPLEKSALPYGNIMNTDIEWSLDTGLPLNTTIKAILDSIENSKDGDLLREPLLLSELMEDSETEVATLDGIIARMNTIKGKMAGMKRSMNAVADELEVTDVIVSDPFRRMGTAQVSTEFKLNDGQSIWVFFHNPDLTPSKIEKGDELISWKWLLNKRDVTIIAAPESGKEVAPKTIAQRLMMLAEKNMKAFAKNKAKVAEKVARIAELKDTLIPDAEKELSGLEKQIEQAEFNKSQNEIKEAEQDQEQRYKDYTVEDVPSLKLHQLRKLAKVKFGVKTLGRVTTEVAQEKVIALFLEEAAKEETEQPLSPQESINNSEAKEKNSFDIKNRIADLNKETDLEPMLDGMKALLADLEKSGDYEVHKNNTELHDISNRITKLQAERFSGLIE